MPRPAITPEKRVEMRAHVREAVLRLARRRGLTAGDSQGWSNITIRDVIEEADISIGTFYKYFKDRSDLAQTLWVEPVNDLRAAMQADAAEASDPAERVQLLLRHYARFALDNPRLFRSVFLFVRPDANQKPEPVKLEDEVFYRELRAAFEEGQSAGIFRQFDPHDMAQIFWAGVHGSLALPHNLDRFDFDSSEYLSDKMIKSLMSLISSER